jgi:hypothetical protein
MKQKNIWLAVFLTIILGPFGLLYCSLPAGATLIAAYYLFNFILPWKTFVSVVFWYTIPTLLAFVLASPDSKTSEQGNAPEPDQELPSSPESEPEPHPEPTETKIINGRTYAKINGQWFEQ